ncbi:MAG: hypothetical protein JOZ15_14725 [Acidobacteria bacterium]|nr:hypothetical protein [Acidobacteriota bacterium]
MTLLGEGWAAMAAEREAILKTAAERSGESEAGAVPAAAVSPLRAETANAQVVLHPYLGYVLNPEIKRWRTPRGRIVAPTITGDGFEATPDDAAGEAGKHEVEIGLFGGSVATFLCAQGRDTLLTELAKFPGFKTKKLGLRCFALGGYKQPQQLMALAYLLALGRKLDIVINLDGFNEVALAFGENWPSGVFPFYPRGWTTLTEGIPDIDRLRLVGSIVDLEDRRAGLARTFSRSSLRYSAICNLLWRALDRRLEARLAETQLMLQRTKPAGRGRFLGHGPKREYRSEDELFRDLAAEWKRSSFEMAHLCAAAGIRYYHFLQPNQYDPGSKPMGAAERRTAYKEDHPYRKGVEKGYPLLSKAGLELTAGGVQFHDARNVFAGIKEPLYVDQCCHFSQKGNQILGAWMAARIVQDLGSAR